MTDYLTAIVLLMFSSVLQASPHGDLVPVDKPLNQLGKELERAATLAETKRRKALKALENLAPKLSERLKNLAEDARELEKETNAVAEAVAKDEKAKTEEVQDLLERQEELNQRVEKVKDKLKRDANVYQQERPELARDADDALAMLKKPPRDAKNALEESTANQAAEQQRASLDTAARNQNELAQALEQLAEHYENLENGEGEKTRPGLREKEAELGIKERLDKKYDDLKEAKKVFEMSDADRLKALEAKLPDNPVMQNALGNIAQDTLDNAKVVLDNNPQQSDGTDHRPSEEGPQQANEQDVKAAVKQARAMAEQEVPKIQKDAEQANAVAANKELKKAKESLEAAAAKGEQALKDPSKSPEEKMRAMGSALNRAAKSLEAAAQKAGERAQTTTDPDQKAAAEKAQAAAKAAAQKAQQMAQKGEPGQQQQAGNDPKKGVNGAEAKDPVEAYMWAYVAREHARKTPGQESNAVKANIHLNQIKKKLSTAELKQAETKAKEILSKL